MPAEILNVTFFTQRVGYEVYIRVQANGKPVGYLQVHPGAQRDLLVLKFLTIEQRFRGHGLSNALLQEFRRTIADLFPDAKGLWGEVVSGRALRAVNKAFGDPLDIHDAVTDRHVTVQEALRALGRSAASPSHVGRRKGIYATWRLPQ